MPCTVHFVAPVVGVIGIILILTSLSTTKWMTGCMLMDDLIKLIKELKNYMPPGYDARFLSILPGTTTLCFNQGLFSVSMRIADHIIQPPPNHLSKPTYIHVAGAILIIGMLGAVASIILFINASCKNDETYEVKSRKRNITRIACLVMACSGLALTLGMAVYAGKSAEMVHNPILFLMQYYRSAASLISSKLHVFGYNGLTRENLYSGNTKDIADRVKTAFQNMDPNYGFSFIIGWMGVILFFISSLIGLYAQHVMVRQSITNNDGNKL